MSLAFSLMLATGHAQRFIAVMPIIATNDTTRLGSRVRCRAAVAEQAKSLGAEFLTVELEEAGEGQVRRAAEAACFVPASERRHSVLRYVEFLEED